MNPVLSLILAISWALTGYCRDYHIRNLYTEPYNNQSKALIYPSFNQCTSADDLNLQLDYPGEVEWSPILNQFLFFFLGEPDRYAEEMIFATIFENALITHVAQASVYWGTLYIGMGLVGIIVIPIIGGICCIISGAILYSLWIAFKFNVRHSIITYERTRRRREKIMLPKKHPHFRRKFVMPHVFRKYSDEETPKILDIHTTGDSNGSESDEEERLIRQLLEQEAKITQQTQTVEVKPPTQDIATETETEKESESPRPAYDVSSMESPVSRGTSSGGISGSDIDAENQLDSQRKTRFSEYGTQTTEDVDLRSLVSKPTLLRRKSHVIMPKKAAFKRKMSRKTHMLDPDANQTKTHDKAEKENNSEDRENSLSPPGKTEKQRKINSKKNPSPAKPTKDKRKPRGAAPSLQSRKRPQVDTTDLAPQNPSPVNKTDRKRSPSPKSPAAAALPNFVRPKSTDRGRSEMPPPNNASGKQGRTKAMSRKPTTPPPTPETEIIPEPTRLRPVRKQIGAKKLSPDVANPAKRGKARTSNSNGTRGSSESPKAKSLGRSSAESPKQKSISTPTLAPSRKP